MFFSCDIGNARRMSANSYLTILKDKQVHHVGGRGRRNTDNIRDLFKMAAVLRRLSFTPYFVLQSQRTFSVAVTLNNKNVVSDDPIKKLFIDKLNEFKKKKVGFEVPLYK